MMNDIDMKAFYEASKRNAKYELLKIEAEKRNLSAYKSRIQPRKRCF